MPCKVCASHHLEPAPLPEEAVANFRLDWCRDCGFVSLVGAPPSLHGRSDDATGDPRSSSRRFLSRIRYLGLHRWLERLTLGHNTGRRILDAGSGLGDLSLDLGRRGWDVWACDAAEDAARSCTPLLGERFVAAPFEEVDLPEAFFDVIVLNFSLEHMEEPRPAAQKISVLLRPGGVVAIRVPNIDAALSGRRGAAFQLQLPHHRSFFGPKSLRRLLEDVGLEVMEITTPLTLLEGVSTACDLIPALDPDRWIHRPSRPANLLKGAALAALAAVALPGAWSLCRDGKGVILYAGARMVER
jgi:2-polyprenyl-3-methyl-5-hydroxy-6-metoxy-1,4-benzoquinol methylase